MFLYKGAWFKLNFVSKDYYVRIERVTTSVDYIFYREWPSIGVPRTTDVVTAQNQIDVGYWIPSQGPVPSHMQVSEGL